MKVKIYQIAKSSMQSAPKNNFELYWKLEYLENLNDKNKDPLMGWTSSNNTNQELNIKFKSLEDALNYAKSFNLEIEVEPYALKSLHRPKAYADNFKFNN